MKQLELTKENFRLLASVISNATSGSMFTKLLKDAGWTPESTLSQEWQLAKKSKEGYLFDEFVKIAEQGRIDIIEFVVNKTVSKSSIYFKMGNKDYKFPRDIFSELKKKLGKKEIEPQKKNIKLFNERKLHTSVIFAGKELFSNKHYSQAIFEVCKLLNKRVQELSGSDLDGKKLMLDVFSVNNPKLKFNNVINQSEKDEQEGFMHLFAGLMHGVRNPKGHEIINLKDPYRALEYLGFISLLFRKLDELK